MTTCKVTAYQSKGLHRRMNVKALPHDDKMARIHDNKARLRRMTTNDGRESMTFEERC